MSTYRIHAMFGQRVCGYEGQYAPELLDAVDEFTNDENPDYLVQSRKKHKADESLVAVVDVLIELDFEKVVDLVAPKQRIIKAEVKEEL